MKKNSHIFLAATLLIWVFNNRAAAQTVNGKYMTINEDGYGMGWYFSFAPNHQFTFYNYTPYEHIFWCCDTMAVGTWQFAKDKKHLLLTSPFETLKVSKLSIIVTEVRKPDQDITKVIFRNPIEDELFKSGRRSPVVDYELYIRQANKLVLFKRTDTNIIELPKGSLSHKITVKIKVKDNPYIFRTLGVKSIECEEYTINDTLSNNFTIDIPKLTFKYIGTLRLKNARVSVKSSRYLIYDKKLFRREDKGQ